MVIDIRTSTSFLGMGLPSIWGGTGTFWHPGGSVLPSTSALPWHSSPVSDIANLTDRDFSSLVQFGGALTMPVLGPWVEFGIPSSLAWSALQRATALAFGPWTHNPFGSQAAWRPGAQPRREAGSDGRGPRWNYEPRSVPGAGSQDDAGDEGTEDASATGKPGNGPAGPKKPAPAPVGKVEGVASSATGAKVKSSTWSATAKTLTIVLKSGETIDGGMKARVAAAVNKKYSKLKIVDANINISVSP